MVTNPYRERYRKLLDGPPLDSVAYSSAKGKLMIELFYALEDALEKIEVLEGKVYELEQTLEGREYPAEREDELVPVGDREWNE